jgi:SAM-dependent MidA family methyltransferase
MAGLARKGEAGHRDMTSSLAARLRERIAAEGPLSVEDFMEACLLDESAGAYTSRQPIGGHGHFITAPEISQIFGELIGLWTVAVWHSMGEPGALTVAELGPGRGTLMADAIRVFSVSPRFTNSVSVALVERSPVLAAAQRDALQGAQVPLRWYGALDEIPAGASIVIANEFLDALPIRQFARRDGAWHERLVANDSGGGFAFAASETAAADHDLFPELAAMAAEGSIV